ncbi:MAG: polyprenyl synthetase family protein [Clostridia bacterium]|nr:polyprenyl synthetase family protein [Clostridia bacterium]
MNDLLKEALSSNSQAIDARINEIYRTYDDPDTREVREAELYSLTAGGKRIRAFLVNEFCRACGGNIVDSLDFAVAIEMMHTFSLIHDDLPCMDNDDMRRGKPTSHKVFGEATALLAGDSLVIRSLMTAANNPQVSRNISLRAVNLICNAVSSEGMIGGQIIDMRGEREELDFKTLLKLHRKKTGEVIIVSAMLGCLAAGVDSDDAKFNAAVRYAEKIGLTFQIIDDILDVIADPAVLGKNVGSDASENKTTFMSFMSVDEARQYAAKLTTEAKEALACFEHADMLYALADYLLVREK